MKVFRNLAIKWKLAAVIMLIITPSLLLATATFYAHEFLILRRSAARQVLVIGRVIGENCTAALTFQDPAVAHRILQAGQTDPALQAVRIFNRDGRLFAAFPALDDPIGEDMLHPIPRHERVEFRHRQVVMTGPIRLDQEIIGAMVLTYGLSGYYQALAHAGATAALILSAGILIAAWLSLLLQHLISQPLVRLTQAARRISQQQDYGMRVEGEGEDEIGMLVASFNSMLEQIQQRDLAIRENADLFRGVFEQSVNGIALSDETGKLATLNPACAPITGLDPQQVIGRPLDELLRALIPADASPDSPLQILRTTLPEFFRTGNAACLNQEQEDVILRADGTLHHIHYYLFALRTARGPKLCAVLRDITRRVEAEAGLRHNLHFESLMLSISARLVNLAGAEVKREIQRALGEIATFLGIDLIFIGQLEPAGPSLQVDCAWTAPGVGEMPRAISLAAAAADWERLRRGESTILAGDQAALGLPLPASCLLVPLGPRQEASHVIGGVTRQTTREWRADDLRMGRIIGDIFINALTRSRMEIQMDQYQEQLRSLNAQLTLAEERERRAIALDLHDTVGQFLAIARMRLDMLMGTPAHMPHAADFNVIKELLDNAIRHTRSLTVQISPPALYSVGPEAALDSLAEQTTRLNAVQVSFEHDGRPKPLEENVRVLLFRATRELMLNAIKHSRASQVRITMARAGRAVTITIADEGIGFDPPTHDEPHRMQTFGLFSLKERLRSIGGKLELTSRPGAGTTAVITAPLQDEPS